MALHLAAPFSIMNQTETVHQMAGVESVRVAPEQKQKRRLAAETHANAGKGVVLQGGPRDGEQGLKSSTDCVRTESPAEPATTGIAGADQAWAREDEDA